MGHGRLRVHCADLERVSRVTTGAADHIDALRSKLANRMDQLGGTWTGPAASAYLTLWTEINDECGDMLGDLRWMGESLQAMAHAYEHHEANSADILNRSIKPTGDWR
jgi:WXG100 family type VII secretion target